ncbi:MAG: hybrid sensor histidine kinase/response regulator, partial [Rhodocyclales bacterium]|nr:hybrid sensor histidine kinase/response regulator [Rhodocyclales bacterium]
MAGNVLIVDDTPPVLKLLKDILSAEGYKARPFNNGELALRSIAAEP